MQNAIGVTGWLGRALTAALLGTVALWVAPAAAQEAAGQQSAELPPVVVQGATLEAKKPKPVKAARPAPDDGDEAPPAKAQKRKAGEAPAEPATGAAGLPGIDVVTAPGTASYDGGDTGGGVPADRLGSAVSVVTGRELRERQVRNGAEALRSLPGVSVNRTGGLAGVSQVRIRGAEANQTLVLIDGIVANSGTDGEFDFADLLTEDIERIEVIRGPQSALYGSGANGGVVNIITRGGRGPLTLVTRAEGGARGTADLAARLSGGNDKAWGSVTIHRQRTDGFNIAPDAILDEKDGSRVTSISANAGFRILPGVVLTLTARDTSKVVDRDSQTGFGPGSTRNGFIVATDSRSVQDGSVQLLGTQLRWDTADGAFTHILKANRNRTERNDLDLADYGFGIFPSLFSNISQVDTFGYQATYRFATPMLWAKHSLTGLVEKERQVFTDADENLTHERGRVSYAAEWTGELFSRLDLVAGTRFDDNDRTEDAQTWRTSASLRLPELAIRPHASVGTAVKQPSQFELFGTSRQFVSNPALTAEKSFGWDAGVEFTVIKGRAILDVTYFSTDLTDKIANQSSSIFLVNPPFACNPGDLFCSRSVNLNGLSKRQGVEIAGRYVVVPGLTVGLAYTWLDAVDRNGKEELRRPPHAGRADLSWAFAGGRGLFTMAAVYNGDMKDMAFAAGTYAPTVLALDSYWLVSATASYKVQPNLELFARVENALDSKYEEVFGFNTGGIAAYAGVKFTFEDPSTAGWARYRE